MEFWQNKSLGNLSCIYNGIIIYERWVDIPDYVGVYQISSFGRIKSIKSKRIHGQRLKRSGVYKGRRHLPYCETALSKSNKRKFVLVHRLALLSFEGNPPTENHTAMHLNDIPYDNVILNLRWGTIQENSIDCNSKGRRPIDFGKMKRMSATRRKNQVTVIVTNQANGKKFEAKSLREASRMTNTTIYTLKNLILNKSKRNKKYNFELAN